MGPVDPPGTAAGAARLTRPRGGEAVWPPSTTMAWPTANDASPERSHRPAAAISSGRVGRRGGRLLDPGAVERHVQPAERPHRRVHRPPAFSTGTAVPALASPSTSATTRPAPSRAKAGARRLAHPVRGTGRGDGAPTSLSAWSTSAVTRTADRPGTRMITLNRDALATGACPADLRRVFTLQQVKPIPTREGSR